MNPQKHIPIERLLDLADDRIDPADAQPLRAHLTSCQICQDELREIQRTVGLMRSDIGEDAPDHVVNRAIRIFRPLQSDPSPLRRILATLNFDSFMVQPAFGLRSGEPTARQILLNAEGYDLDLRITPHGSQWAISGQVLGPDTSGEIALRADDTQVRAQLNELSEFALPLVPDGTYTLDVRLQDVTIEFGGLELGR